MSQLKPTLPLQANDGWLVDKPKLVGYFVFHRGWGDARLEMYRRPRWITRAFFKYFLEMEWKDAGK